MDGFRLFLESGSIPDLLKTAFLARFDYTPRLALADWLRENGYWHIGEMINYGNNVNRTHLKPTGSAAEVAAAFRKRVDGWNELLQKAHEEVREHGVDFHFTAPGDYVTAGEEPKQKRYDVGLKGVLYTNSRRQRAYVPLEKLPYPVLAAVAAILASRMYYSRDNATGYEAHNTLERAWREFFAEYTRGVLRPRRGGHGYEDPRMQIDLSVLRRLAGLADEVAEALKHVDKDTAATYPQIRDVAQDLLARERHRAMVAARQPWADLHAALVRMNNAYMTATYGEHRPDYLRT